MARRSVRAAATRSGTVAAVLLLAVLAARFAGAGLNEWTTRGPYGGYAHHLVIDPLTPSTLYVGTVNGIFKSTDGGATWYDPAGGFFDYTDILTLAIDPADPTTLYAGFAEWPSAEIYKSTDGGATWSRSSEGLNGIGVVALLVDPVTPSTLYAALADSITTVSDRIYKSTDGGATWNAIAGGGLPEWRRFGSLALAPSDPAILYAGVREPTGPGVHAVYRSGDGGATWARRGESLFLFSSLAVDPRDSAIVYASDYERVLKTSDGGATWSALDGSPAHVGVLAIDPANPSVVYAGASSDFFRSADAGASWSPVGNSFAGRWVSDVAFSPVDPDVIAAAVPLGTDPGGVYTSGDGGLTWSPVRHGIRAHSIYSLASAPADRTILYAGTAASGVYKSGDGGGSWTWAGLSGVVRALAIDPADPATVYAGNRRQILKSTDGAASWTSLGTPDPVATGRIQVLAVDPAHPRVIYAGTKADRGVSLFKSSDGGVSWGRLPLPELSGGVNAIIIDPEDTSTLYVGGEGGWEEGSLFKSTDGGETLAVLEIGSGYYQVSALAIDPREPTTVYAAVDREGVFRSTDGGGTWTAFNDGLDNLFVHSLVIDPREPATLYAAVYASHLGGGGVFQSTDRGEHWRPVGPGLPLSYARVLAVGGPRDRTLYAGAFGVYEIDPGCHPDGETLCLDDRPGDGRFEIRLRYDTVLGGGRAGDAGAIALSPLGVTRGCVLWFFDPTNPEVLVKVLDGCGFNDRFWVFYAATTTVGFTLTVADKRTGVERVYSNPDLTNAAPVTDVEAFACIAAGAGGSQVGAADPGELRGAAGDGFVAGSPGAGFVAAAPGAASGLAKEDGGSRCEPDPRTLCIDRQSGDGRFRITLDYDTELGGGLEGEAGAISLASLGVDQGGILWFFDPANPEVLVKVLDGCAVNDRFWLFYAATTTVGFTLTVEDTVTGETKSLANPDLSPAVPVADIEAFASCNG